jgi:hypothetical protein
MYTVLNNYTTPWGRDKSGLSVPEPAERVRARPRTGGAVGDGREWYVTTPATMATNARKYKGGGKARATRAEKRMAHASLARRLRL